MPLAGGEVLDGPISARVVRVIDGDSLIVQARIWVGQQVETGVRILGVDAPELRGRCRAERDLAQRSRAFLEQRVGGRQIRLRDVQLGKYAGRVVARVDAWDGEDLGQALVAAGLARPYDGGPRKPWCATSPASPPGAARQPSDESGVAQKSVTR